MKLFIIFIFIINLKLVFARIEKPQNYTSPVNNTTEEIKNTFNKKRLLYLIPFMIGFFSIYLFRKVYISNGQILRKDNEANHKKHTKDYETIRDLSHELAEEKKKNNIIDLKKYHHLNNLVNDYLDEEEVDTNSKEMAKEIFNKLKVRIDKESN